ncbi:MAG: phosphoribosyltransferase family protein [Flavobacteriaceae bacterium]
MAALGNKIKNADDIKSSIKRIAYQVYENNLEEVSLVIVGVGKRGGRLSRLLGESLEAISSLKLTYVDLSIDKKNPYQNIQSNVPLESLINQPIVIVDDVLNTGSTLIYAVSYFLQVPVKRIKTAVMVNRNHKKFPIKADFKGISLSTSINEHITVTLDGEASGIYLS